MIWFLLLTRASELYLVQFLYVYVCIFDTEDMTTVLVRVRITLYLVPWYVIPRIPSQVRYLITDTR